MGAIRLLELSHRAAVRSEETQLLSAMLNAQLDASESLALDPEAVETSQSMIQDDPPPSQTEHGTASYDPNPDDADDDIYASDSG
jgi:hypothetical protein